MISTERARAWTDDLIVEETAVFCGQMKLAAKPSPTALAQHLNFWSQCGEIDDGEEGISVGTGLGSSVGSSVGVMVGDVDGSAVGTVVGRSVGTRVGSTVVGGTEGSSVGTSEGTTEAKGVKVRDCGAGVPLSTSFLGAAVVLGVTVGGMLGCMVGEKDGSVVGISDGTSVGRLVGGSVGVFVVLHALSKFSM